MWWIRWFLGSAAAVTAIGHPDVHGASGNQIVFDELEVQVETLQLRRCNGQPLSVDVDDVVAQGESLSLPNGCFDRLRVQTGWLHATGHGEAGGTFELDLACGQLDVEVHDDFAVPGATPSVLTLAETDWVTAASLGLVPGVHRVVAVGDPLYVPLCKSLKDHSSLGF